jgi:hypothetical protein
VILLDANQTVAGLDVALPPMPTFDDYYRLSSVNGTTLQESDSMISVIPLFAAALPDRLDFQDWNRRFTLVVTARTRVRQTRLDYTTGVDTLRTEVQRLTQPGVRLVVGAGLQGVVDGAQRFRDEIRQSQREVERTLRMPPTLATI